MTNDKFRDAVEFHFGDREDIQSKKHLEILMRRRKFFNASNPEKRIEQTQKLLDDAWAYLKEKEIKETHIAKEYKDYSIEVVKGKTQRKLVRDKKTGRIKGWV